ncbi:MAG: hypothetical protein IJH12_09840 [Clostridia bacterium]|nr:hypothetical protein [Clostridia bacterium]
MDGDMNDIFQKLNSIMSDKEASENIKNIMNNLTSSSSSSTNSTSDINDSNNPSQNSPNFDMATILKLKSIIDNINSTQNDSRTNLLNSLKPYLKDSKKEKIDQYIKFLKIAAAFESLNLMGGDSKIE